MCAQQRIPVPSPDPSSPTDPYPASLLSSLADLMPERLPIGVGAYTSHALVRP